MNRTPLRSISSRAAFTSSTRKPATGDFMKWCSSAIARGPKISKTSPSSRSNAAKSGVCLRTFKPKTSVANRIISSKRSVGLPSHAMPLTFISVLPEQPIQPFDRTRASRCLIDIDDDTVELHRSGRHLEPPRNAVPEAPDDDVLIHPEHGIARADHARVRHVSGALRKDARVRRGHVRVGTDDGGEAAVEMPAHRDLLARRFGVPIENADARGVAAELIEEAVEGAERVVGGRHERPSDRVHHKNVLDHDPPSSRIAGREVDRPDREREQLDVVEELALVPDVVPVRDHVRAGGIELARDVGREPRAARGVLTVHDREVDPIFLADLREERLDRVAPRTTNDVANKQDLQGGSSETRGTRTTWRTARTVCEACRPEGPRARGVPVP